MKPGILHSIYSQTKFYRNKIMNSQKELIKKQIDKIKDSKLENKGNSKYILNTSELYINAIRAGRS
jgi:hypothetical protein